MKLWAVTREGVYRHGICGIFTSQEAAEFQAWFSLMSEKDDYHSFDVLEFMANQGVEDGAEVASFTRVDGVAHKDGKEYILEKID